MPSPYRGGIGTVGAFLWTPCKLSKNPIVIANLYFQVKQSQIHFAL